jgi:hypothetical protein
MEINKDLKTNVSKYIRVPKKVEVPFMGDMQSRKNPFSKPVRYDTLKPKHTGTLINCQNSCGKRVHANTFVNPQSPPCPEFFVVQRHEDISVDVTDTVTVDYCEWIFEEQIEDESDYENGQSNKLIPYELILEIQHNFSIMESLEKATLKEIKVREVVLKPVKRKSNKTLALDLDDTLIHMINPKFGYSYLNVCHSSAQIVLYKDIDTLSLNSIKVLIRPYALKLLEELAEIYEIVVIVYGNN